MPGRLFSKYFVHKVTDEGSLCQFASKPGRLFSQGGLITDEGTDERADYIESIMPLASLYWRRHKHLGPLPRPHRIKPLNACTNCLPRLRHISIIGLKFDFTELVASKLADILQIFKQRFVWFSFFCCAMQKMQHFNISNSDESFKDVSCFYPIFITHAQNVLNSNVGHVSVRSRTRK